MEFSEFKIHTLNSWSQQTGFEVELYHKHLSDPGKDILSAPWFPH